MEQMGAQGRLDTPVVVALWIALASAVVSITGSVGQLLLHGVTQFVMLQLAVAVFIAWKAFGIIRANRHAV